MPAPSIEVYGIEWFGGEHHAKNPLDKTAGDYMGLESGLQLLGGWGQACNSAILYFTDQSDTVSPYNGLGINAQVFCISGCNTDCIP